MTAALFCAVKPVSRDFAQGIGCMAICRGLRLRQAPDVVACQLDGGNALLDLASSDYYRLNRTAASIWDGIGEGLTVPEIVDRLLSHYEVEYAQCAADVEAVVSALLDAELIIACD